MMKTKKPVDSEQVGGMLGEGVSVEGSLTFNQTFRVDGTFSGKILDSDRLVIGENGKVTGEVDVNSLVVYGRLEGTLKVKGSVEVHPKGWIKGEVQMNSPLLTIMEGGMIEGQLQLSGTESGNVTPMPSKGQKE